MCVCVFGEENKHMQLSDTVKSVSLVFSTFSVFVYLHAFDT